ncbi:MAG: PD-(D/E)XK nuclease family protein, partial [Bacteroidales bacterium]
QIKQIDEIFPYFTPEQQELIARFWHHFHVSRDSKEKEQFSALWQKLYSIYQQFKTILLQQGIAYEGMLFREVAELFNSNTIQIPYSRVGFVGLHALTECDRVILNYFKNVGTGLFYWDYHPHFIEDEAHEAGYFIRQNLKAFPSALPTSFFERDTTAQIEIIAAPYPVGQTKRVENIITSIAHKSTAHENMAIVLADETLFLPLLRAIPPAVVDVNVTMGYPLRLTNIYTLFQQIVELHLQGRHDHGFYYKQVEKLLYHPYFLKLMPEWVRTFVNTMHANNQVYLSASAFSEVQVPLIPQIFKDFANAGMEMLLETFLKICNDLYTRLFTNEEADGNGEEKLEVEKESLQAARMFLSQLQTVADLVDIPLSATLGMRIVLKGLSELKIAFEGEPLRGLQIMGFLETRALDFDKIIILGANEGYLPRTHVPISFIPFSLRTANGLPTLKNSDAMYAYNFYRLLNRSSYVWLLYSTSGDQVSEKSRYIRQLEWNPDYRVRQKNITLSLETIGVEKIEIAKNSDILNKIHELTATPQSYLSPSAIASYLNCSLQFYFRYIVGLKPTEEIREKVDSASLGTILHKLMQNLYAPYVGKRIVEMNIDRRSLDSHIEDITRKHFGLSKQEVLPASLKVIIPIVKKYCELILDFDQHNCWDHKLLKVEETFTSELKLTEQTSVHIGGRMDRIDEHMNGQIRIIDYKTGYIGSKRYAQISDLFSRENWEKRELLQAIIYAWLYYRNKNLIPWPVLYNVQHLAMKKEIIFVSLSGNNKSKDSLKNNAASIELESMKNVEKLLLQIISELFDPTIKFIQTNDKNLCHRCPYNVICRR